MDRHQVRVSAHHRDSHLDKGRRSSSATGLLRFSGSSGTSVVREEQVWVRGGWSLPRGEIPWTTVFVPPGQASVCVPNDIGQRRPNHKGRLERRSGTGGSGSGSNHLFT